MKHTVTDTALPLAAHRICYRAASPYRAHRDNGDSSFLSRVWGEAPAPHLNRAKPVPYGAGKCARGIVLIVPSLNNYYLT